MDKEEKEAIEILKDNIGILEGKLTIKHTNYNTVKAYNTILNLIDKQQKEIESLKKGNKSLMDSRKKWKDRYYKQRYIDYKQEKEIEELDTINEKIKELEWKKI